MADGGGKRPTTCSSKCKLPAKKRKLLINEIISEDHEISEEVLSVWLTVPLNSPTYNQELLQLIRRRFYRNKLYFQGVYFSLNFSFNNSVAGKISWDLKIFSLKATLTGAAIGTMGVASRVL